MLQECMVPGEGRGGLGSSEERQGCMKGVKRDAAGKIGHAAS